MGVRQASYNPDQGVQLLKQALMEQAANKQPGVTPSGIAQNAYFNSMPNTSEQEREAQSYDQLGAEGDARAAAAAARDTATAGVQNSARTYGYASPRAQQDAENAQKLKMVLAPEQVKLDAAGKMAEAARSNLDQQKELSRESTAGNVQATQQGMTERNNATLGVRNAEDLQKHSPGIFSGLGQRLGISAPPTPATPAGAPGSVHMVTPDGRDMPAVPASQVQRLTALGAKVVP